MNAGVTVVNLIIFANKPIGEECLHLAINMMKAGKLSIECVISSSEEKSWWGETRIRELCASNAIKYCDSLEIDVKKIRVKAKEESWLISVQNSIVFESDLLSAFNGKTANLHLAPLPRYRGWYGPSHAILEGDKFYGWTIHQMTENLDVGAVLASGRLEISSRETAKSLYKKTESAAITGFEKFLTDLTDDKLFREEMDMTLSRYYGKSSLEPFRTINLNTTTAEECDRIMRGMYFPPHPMPSLLCD